jgi:predicted porin
MDSRNLGDYLMKKSLLVLAVAAAVPALAQAQTNVTFYGRIDQAIGYEKNSGGAAYSPTTGVVGAATTPGAAVSLLSGVQSSNRWGVRGSEDLGGGLKAIFNLEGGFDADVGRGLGNTPGTGSNANTTGTLDFRRRSVAGLEGGFGTLVLGRDYDPLFRVLLGSDTLGLGHYNNVHTNFGTSYGVRIDNGIHYVSPSLGGFVLRGAYGFSENFTNVPNIKAVGRALSVAGEFSTGPLYVGLGYRGNTVANGTDSANSIIAGESGVNKYLAAGARYNFGAFAINGGFGKRDPAGSGNNTKTFWLGGDVQAGPGRLHLQFITMNTDLAVLTPQTAAAVGSKPTAKGVGITYNYPLSKRTNAYLTAGLLSNNAAGNFGMLTSSTSVGTGGTGGDPKGIALGLGHNF